MCAAASLGVPFPGWSGAQGAEQSNGYSLTLPLIFEGAYQGDVPVFATASGDVNVQAQRFIALLGRRISAELAAKVISIADAKGLISLSQLTAAGIRTEYDSSALELHVSIPVASQGSENLSVVERRSAPDAANLSPPENFAATAIVTAQQTYTWNGSSGRKLSPLRASADIGANFGGPSGFNVFVETEYEHRLGLGRLVAFHDDLSNAIRYSVGDVAPVAAGFQTSPAIGGLSVQRLYGEIQPYANIRPSGRFGFVLEKPSTVELVVNGVTARSYQLDSGQYNLSDFSFFNGLNDIQIFVTDEYGRRLLTTYSQYFSARLLNRGTLEFGATAGVLNQGGSLRKRYQWHDPAFSGYARYGLTNSLTLGVNGQATRRQWMGGGELAWASPIGTFATVAGISGGRQQPTGTSVLMSYELIGRAWALFERPQFNLELQKTSRYFTPIADVLPVNRFSLEGRTRLATQVAGFGLGLAGSYSKARIGADEYRLAANVSHRVWRANVSASAERVRGNPILSEDRFLITATIPLGTGANVRTGYDSRGNQFTAEYSRFQRDEVDSLGLRASVIRDDFGVTGAGELSYFNNRFTANLQHVLLTDSGLGKIRSQQTSYTIATQVALAGSHVAVGRPVGQRFAIVSPHPTLGGATVNVSQGEGQKRPQARSGVLGPALAPVGNAYTSSPLLIDVPDAPSGYDIGSSQFAVLPGVVSGYAFTVGSDASHIIMGTAVGTDGKPLGLLGGEAVSLDDPNFKPVVVFTNRAGRFVANGLVSGHLELRLGPNGEYKVRVMVPKESTGIVDAGTVVATE